MSKPREDASPAGPRPLGDEELDGVSAGFGLPSFTNGGVQLVTAWGTVGWFGGDNDRDRLGGGNDAIAAGGGNDTVEGGGGDDTLSGNGGNDRLEDGRGNDLLYGGAGSDVLEVRIEHGSTKVVDHVSGDRDSAADPTTQRAGDTDGLVLWNVREWSQVQISFTQGGFAGPPPSNSWDFRQLQPGSSGTITVGSHTVTFDGIEGISLRDNR